MAGKHDHIAGSLINDILSGRYQPEDRLPSERDLSARFDANRGAVREAMKKLEHLGFAEIQPGGARVKERTEANLDALGHILDQAALPDMVLVDQILVVINSLMSIAAELTLEMASDDELADIRALTEPLLDEATDKETHTLARFELMRAIMISSNNLPLQMIAKSLTDQAIPKLAELSKYAEDNYSAYATFARQLDQSIENKDLDLLRASFVGLTNLNRETMMRAFQNAQAAIAQESATS